MISYAFIEKEEKMESYCMKRFSVAPKMIEHYAHIGNITIEKLEVYDNVEDRYRIVYAIYFDSLNGISINQFEEKLRYDYQQIKADKNFIK